MVLVAIADVVDVTVLAASGNGSGFGGCSFRVLVVAWVVGIVVV